jgi:phage terminase large subunit-like protein
VRPQWVESAAADPTLAFLAREWDKSAAVPGAWFDAALADRIVELWPKYFRHTEGRWYNKPFVLSRWQEAIVRLLVGWKTEDGFRLYRRLLLWVGKKSGKSEFLAALALLFWAFDKEYGGQGFCFARNENQANIVFKKMKTMIGMSNELAADVQVFKKSLYCAALGQSLFKLLAGTTEGQHGISASVVVGDEMHEWRDDGLATTLHQSTSARSQPIELFGSTAGIKGKGYGWDLWEETQSLIEGRLADPTTLAVIFAVAADADWTDEKLWPLACPNIGISPTWAFLRAECAKAKVNPRLEANFRRYYLNQWVSALSRWIPVPRWDACASDKAAWRTLPEHAQGSQLLGHARPLQDPRHHGAVPAVRAGRRRDAVARDLPLLRAG